VEPFETLREDLPHCTLAYKPWRPCRACRSGRLCSLFTQHLLPPHTIFFASRARCWHISAPLFMNCDCECDALHISGVRAVRVVHGPHPARRLLQAAPAPAQNFMRCGRSPERSVKRLER
jgi:hypothetical protein